MSNRREANETIKLLSRKQMIMLWQKKKTNNSKQIKT